MMALALLDPVEVLYLRQILQSLLLSRTDYTMGELHCETFSAQFKVKWDFESLSYSKKVHKEVMIMFKYL